MNLGKFLKPKSHRNSITEENYYTGTVQFSLGNTAESKISKLDRRKRQKSNCQSKGSVRSGARVDVALCVPPASPPTPSRLPAISTPAEALEASFRLLRETGGSAAAWPPKVTVFLTPIYLPSFCPLAPPAGRFNLVKKNWAFVQAVTGGRRPPETSFVGAAGDQFRLSRHHIDFREVRPEIQLSRRPLRFGSDLGF
jgi:hypothetical protein